MASDKSLLKCVTSLPSKSIEWKPSTSDQYTLQSKTSKHSACARETCDDSGSKQTPPPLPLSVARDSARLHHVCVVQNTSIRAWHVGCLDRRMVTTVSPKYPPERNQNSKCKRIKSPVVWVYPWSGLRAIWCGWSKPVNKVLVSRSRSWTILIQLKTGSAK